MLQEQITGIKSSDEVSGLNIRWPNTNPVEGALWPKLGRAILQDTKTKNDAPTMPLTQANIPQIVEAVLNILSAPQETTHDDDLHTQENLGKPVTT